jgi:hypothetical protein
MSEGEPSVGSMSPAAIERADRERRALALHPSDATFDDLAGEDAQRARELLVNRLTPLMPSATATPEAGAPDTEGVAHDAGSGTPVVYRITLTEKTGRFETASLRSA